MPIRCRYARTFATSSQLIGTCGASSGTTTLKGARLIPFWDNAVSHEGARGSQLSRNPSLVFCLVRPPLVHKRGRASRRQSTPAPTPTPQVEFELVRQWLSWGRLASCGLGCAFWIASARMRYVSLVAMDLFVMELIARRLISSRIVERR